MNDEQLTAFLLKLTRRQREVLELVVAGLTNAQVAARLYIEPGSVADNLTTIYENLGCYEPYTATRPNRYVLITAFANYYRRRPEMQMLH